MSSEEIFNKKDEIYNILELPHVINLNSNNLLKIEEILNLYNCTYSIYIKETHKSDSVRNFVKNSFFRNKIIHNITIRSEKTDYIFFAVELHNEKSRIRFLPSNSKSKMQQKLLNEIRSLIVNNSKRSNLVLDFIFTSTILIFLLFLPVHNILMLFDIDNKFQIPAFLALFIIYWVLAVPEILKRLRLIKNNNVNIDLGYLNYKNIITQFLEQYVGINLLKQA